MDAVLAPYSGAEAASAGLEASARGGPPARRENGADGARSEPDAQKARVLQRFIDHRRTRRAALEYALSPDVFRQGRLDDLILRLLIALRYI